MTFFLHQFSNIVIITYNYKNFVINMIYLYHIIFFKLILHIVSIKYEISMFLKISHYSLSIHQLVDDDK